ncbi:hypothetical protein AJ80_03232 [Polytolypa hystricis UAMH7299]|uniref:Long-chain-alcohol oxidase n=1 Tax=Polytolypa hystricis (strain UAMH7299) TaxID=1447883 RepID=A0A2B7YK54_POLH7|nr:hypothetical protein AJ80_03232 [Polytolypa hystricis UAMH7299]
MASVTTYDILDSPLPPAPPDTILNQLQWDTLLAMADVVVPTLKPKSTADPKVHLAVDDDKFNLIKQSIQSRIDHPQADALATQYLEENALSTPEYKDSLCRLLANNIPSEARRGISFILTALNTLPGSLLLTGSPTPFRLQPLDVRISIFRSWKSSYLAPMRAIHKSMVALFFKSWLPLSPTLERVIGFPRVPVHGNPAEGYPYEFLQFPPGDDPETIETDIVIIGSGCGAGVTAKKLAEAGHRVIVVEKSHHISTKHFPMTMKDGPSQLFANGGAELSDDGSIAVLSGSTWGGGGTVNWSACLQTQSFVRQEWADAGLPFFTSAAFQNCLDRVCDYMGVSDHHIEHNHGNRVLLEGARKLGYTAKPVPQNTGNQAHYCGYCALGCAANIKQGPAVSYLADAARAGATFIEGFQADKVLFHKQRSGKTTVVQGVRGTWTSRDANGGRSGEPLISRQVIINAKKVVVSCGSLESPLLLMRSGLMNPQLGRNLYLHPVVIMSATFDKPVRPWEGGILTSVVTEFENLDGRGHGSKIETLSMLPAMVLPLFCQDDGLENRILASQAGNLNGFISLTRDRDSGRVYPDPVSGKCRIQYTPSIFDRHHMLQGAIGCAKMAYISGAREIRFTSSAVPPFVRSDTDSDSTASSVDEEGINNPSFQAWLKKLSSSVALPPEKTYFASAHQMGTCRMGSSPKASVVDPQGQVWGTEGLYVADASVFPSASGVNPMITNLAISEWTAENLVKEMERERKGEVRTARL